MDRSQRDLESIVASQKEQLKRYETRLKDVVTAYKGLLKEKEALETSLAAVTTSTDESAESSAAEKGDGASASFTANSSDNIQLQIATLMNSLATLSAEKSRMEASFQADKKHLRAEIVQKETRIKEIHEKTEELRKQHAAEIETVKSKIIVERHEREKESNNHMVMIRELQKLYADERHLKENLEMQLNDLKNQFSSTGYADSKVKDLSRELSETKEKLKRFENQKVDYMSDNSSNILQQLQNEMQHLKQQHSIAIKTEQKRALMAEERNKKLAALHEDRVANLEARLAELSSTVGTYDRLRQQDQENIQKLKDKIVQLANAADSDTKPPQKICEVQSIVDEILQLKKMLLIESARNPNSVDINKIFNTGADHTQCLEDCNKLQSDLEAEKAEKTNLLTSVDTQKSHIKTLQEKIKVLNRNIDEQEVDLKAHAERIVHAVKTERTKWRNAMESMENEYRVKLNTLEHQLQKQRARSLQLLDEKENEIRALKTSFEIFIPQQQHIQEDAEASDPANIRKISASHLNTILNSNLSNASNGSSSALGENSCHMLHYVHELARKDVEISGLRKAKHTAETALRQALHDKVTSQEELNDQIMKLEQDVDRLERCKTREGANLEYLKNVILSYLSSTDADGKKHMINAIAAVLQFTPGEMKTINKLLYKK